MSMSTFMKTSKNTETKTKKLKYIKILFFKTKDLIKTIVTQVQTFTSYWLDKFLEIKSRMTLTFDVMTSKSIGSFTVYYKLPH